MVSVQVAQECFTELCKLVLKKGPTKQQDSAQKPTPVVYSTSYNISFAGLEKLHPFDPCKYAKVWEPCEVPEEVVEAVHSTDYLKSLHSSPVRVAKVVELPPLGVLPMCLLDRALLKKMRIQVGGTILSVGLAVAEGYSIQVGGGMHHASWNNGEGWCPYSDITMSIQQVRAASKGAVQNVWVIDTDAHQGNGYARDKIHFQDSHCTIIDLYNADVFPADAKARTAINVERQLHCGCDSQMFLDALTSALKEADECAEAPDLVIHNAGTDILDKDPLGRMCVSPEAVQQRDMQVWQHFRQKDVPVCMLLSGGYAKQSAAVISASLAAILKREAEAVQCSHIETLG